MLCSASGALCASTIMTIVSIDVILPSRALLFHFLDTGHISCIICVCTLTQLPSWLLSWRGVVVSDGERHAAVAYVDMGPVRVASPGRWLSRMIVTTLYMYIMRRPLVFVRLESLRGS